MFPVFPFLFPALFLVYVVENKNHSQCSQSRLRRSVVVSLIFFLDLGPSENTGNRGN